jgi:hypothetical protein
MTTATTTIADARLARSWSACHACLFPDPTSPPKSWEVSVAGFLFERGYHPDSIRRVLDHATLLGSVECSAELSFSDHDRAEVEARLPEQPIGNWARREYIGTWMA